MTKLKYSILALGLLALTASCDKTAEPILQAEAAAEQTAPIEPLDLSLQAEVDLSRYGEGGDELRNLEYKVDGVVKRAALPEGKALHSLCIIASEDGATKYYVALDWMKMQGKDAFRLEKIDAK